MGQSTGSVARQYTYADLQSFPEDNLRREIIDGELFVNPSPIVRHQRVAGNLYDLLKAFAKITGGRVFFAPLDVFFSDKNVVEPDLLLIRVDHLYRIGEKRMDGPPDLVVEISSPSTRCLDQVRKRDLYERFGVAEFWFVDLEAERIEVYVLRDGGYGAPQVRLPGETVEPGGLPGLTIPVTRFWLRGVAARR